MIIEMTEIDIEETSGGVPAAVIIVGYVVIGWALAAGADYLDGGFND
nr:class IIb bacteriocin, lactobin A/cerein 7B family [uncultured Sphingomonas sp.]